MVMPPAHQETIAAAQGALNVFHMKVQQRAANAIKSAGAAEALWESSASGANFVLRRSRFRPAESQEMAALQVYIVKFLHIYGRKIVNDCELQTQLGSMADQMGAKFKRLL